MRRVVVVVAAGMALLAGACSGGDDKSDATDDNGANASAIAAGFSDVCGSKDAIRMASSFRGPDVEPGGDFARLADALERAAKAAPDELKADFQILVDAEVPFFRYMAKANGDYKTAFLDPAFGPIAEKMDDEKVPAAAQNITVWFNNHCNG